MARRPGVGDGAGDLGVGVAERVSTGLLLTELAVQPVAHDMLAAANRIATLEGEGR
ncbi:hypothetical protein [Dactylosporangium sp. NPDC048998]|uniref:hypothetical protein n=1 Tax=Dactylosporangium sp. NPDC048998 TaxID=3363976 RepID=UPI00372464AA